MADTDPAKAKDLGEIQYREAVEELKKLPRWRLEEIRREMNIKLPEDKRYDR